jgi:hypothetical protein
LNEAGALRKFNVEGSYFNTEFNKTPILGWFLCLSSLTQSLTKVQNTNSLIATHEDVELLVDTETLTMILCVLFLIEESNRVLNSNV